MINLGVIIDNITKGAGTERAVVNMANGLLELYPNSYKIEIISLFSKEPETPYFELNENVRIVHLGLKNNPPIEKKIFFYRNLYIQIKKITEEAGLDVLMGTTYIHNIIMAMGNVSNSSKIKFVACEHVTYDYPNSIIKMIRKYVYKFTNHVVVLNDYEASKFKFLKNLSVVPNIISLPEFNSGNIAEQNIVKHIISVGRLTHEKGIDLFIDVAEKIHSKDKKLLFKIFGEGDDFSNLNEKTVQNGLDEVITFAGSVNDFNLIYTADSILLSTSRTESFGLSIIEAMAMGVPVISFSNTGPKRIITNNVDGILIDKDDTDAMAEKCLDLVSNQLKRNLLKQNALRTAENYTPEKVIPLWNQLLLNVCGKSITYTAS